MTAPTVSVVIVSRGRAADLPRCLLGVSQLDYPSFEVVLVVDPEGHAAAHRTDLYDHLKIVPFDEANISAARNLGIAEAAGEIIAFIDDDAVPEPTWLKHLTAAFTDPEVSVVGGFVRGRNGISFQWKARSVDSAGRAYPLEVSEEQTSVLTPKLGRAIKTEGTNMAVRRDILAEIGGFDPAFRFFLDETDVNMRLAKLGHRTAIAPLAQVHHGYKASASRRQDRTPTDLFEIGASQAVYVRKHAHPGSHAEAIAQMRQDQRQRAHRLLVSGQLEPRDVRYLLKRLNQGFTEGLQREISSLRPIGFSRTGFKPFPQLWGGHEVLVGRIWNRRKLHEKARFSVQGGRRTSLFVMSPTMRPHRVQFSSTGFWLQSGGQFGRSNRNGSHLRLATIKSRLSQELKRISNVRDMFHK